MPEEEIQHRSEPQKDNSLAKPTKKKHILLIVIICVVFGVGLLSVGGYLGYRYYKKQQQLKTEKQRQLKEKELQEAADKGLLPEPKQSQLYQVKIPIEKPITQEEIHAQIKQ